MLIVIDILRTLFSGFQLSKNFSQKIQFEKMLYAEIITH